MFTGLVQDIGVIRSIDKSSGGWRIEIETALPIEQFEIGASVCCSGCCLSVVEKSTNTLSFDVSSESLDKTVIGSWKQGSRVNLEPSLKLGDELGGHIVSGHVDVVTEISSIKQDGDSYRLKVNIPNQYGQYIAAKGSITLDGISLTVNEVEESHFGVNIIPHTWQHTTLSSRKEGDQINLEIDMLARYVARMLEQRDVK